MEAFSCLPATLKLSYLQYLLLLHTFLLYQIPEKNTGCSLAIFSQKCTIKTQIARMFLATVHKNTNSLFSLRHRDTAFLYSSNLHTTWQQAPRHHAVSFFIRLLVSQIPCDLSASGRWLDMLSQQGEVRPESEFIKQDAHGNWRENEDAVDGGKIGGKK